MLFLMMEVKGKLNHRLIKKATFGEMHFDESINFISIEKDKITGAVRLCKRKLLANLTKRWGLIGCCEDACREQSDA